MTDAENALRDELVATGFKRGTYLTYSDGTKGNNKLELDYETLYRQPELLGRVVMGLCELIEPMEAGYVVGVPSGATGLAAAISKKLLIPQVRLEKNKDKSFRLASYTDSFVLEQSVRGVLVDDVYRTGSNFQKAITLIDSYGGDIIGAVAVFDRGLPSKRKHVLLPFEVSSVVSMHISERLSRHSMVGRNLDKL